MKEELPLIIIVCTGNSCRSQMAHAFLERALDGRARVESAGSAPAGYVHPLAIRVMAEQGYDLSEAKSQHVNEFHVDEKSVVVTVCDNAREDCPCLSTAVCYHWEFDDPARVEGTEAEELSAFRRIRDQIKEVFLSRLDQLILRREAI
ncbi:arsenate reductase ArsC [Rubritalea tangerina]|uniref:Arsenate reductase ArsC n=1 Tax=Rubritalea tangerina TaxID=430798 RepID=A0ABW4ZD37_9BACT